MTNIRVINSQHAECQSVVQVSSAVTPPFIPRPAVTAVEAKAPRILSKSTDAQTTASRSSPRTVDQQPDQGSEENDSDDDDDDGKPLSTHAHPVLQEISDEDASGQHSMSLSDTASVIAESSAMESDQALADELAHMTDNGIFEVLLPGGESLGVAVDVRASGIGFLLSSSDDKLRNRLQKQQMELESTLKQRMGRNVKIAIL